MIQLKSVKADEVEEMVDLFAIDDRVFQVPAKPRVGVALRVFEIIEAKGEAVGQSAMLKLLLGQEAFDALCADEVGLDTDALNAITKEAMELCMGGVEKPLGNSDGGSSK